MPDLEIIFKTKAELAGAIAAREALERQVGAAKALGQATTELEAKIARMNQTLAQHAAAGGEGGLGHFLAQISEQALKAIPGLEGVAGAVGKLARGPLTAAGVGLQAAALGFKTLSASIAQFAQAEPGMAKLDRALAQAGQLTEAQPHLDAAKEVLAYPKAVDPAVLRAARQAEAPLERRSARTSQVAAVSAGKATEGEGDFEALPAQLAEPQKVKAKAGYDAEQALMNLTTKIDAFTRSLESLAKTGALQPAAQAVKQATEARNTEEAQIKKYLEALGKKGDEIGDVIGQMGDAMLEALDSALQKAVEAKRKAEQAATRAASPQ